MRVLLVYRLNKVKWPNLHKETLDTRNKPEQNKTIKQRVWRRREQSEGGEQCVLTSVNPRLQMERTCESMELLECENSLINDGNWCKVSVGAGWPPSESSQHIAIIPEYRFPISVCACVGLSISVTNTTTTTTTNPSSSLNPTLSLMTNIWDLHIYNGKDSTGSRGTYIERYECKK